ncbi:MAG: 30S ribosomal protein S12 methylthiotransferase RimO, partial [Firmicutes bacterium]|nr:30S ribosomal protein S12 methylthiotransferase RimO [Bacillota bacterium]
MSDRSPGTQVAIVSLGCAKNLVDSEVMAGLLQEAGFGLTVEADEADVVVVNTCGFIEPAQR